MSDFSQWPLRAELLEALASQHMTVPTPIQQAALSDILAGRDVLAQAKTGSGKTLAFALGLLQGLKAPSGVQALVLCPTRELADQVTQAIRKVAVRLPNVKVSAFYGGIPVRVHVESLVHEPAIVVGTPGRILELIETGALKLEAMTRLVLDEADRMLDMGFEPAIQAIRSALPANYQTLLFSATFPEAVRALSKSYQRDPLEILLDTDTRSEHIEQLFFEVPGNRKNDALLQLLGQLQPAQALVFCNTKIDCQNVEQHLAKAGFDVCALHGDLEQRDRDEAMVRFQNGSVRVLVATDVAARGLDVSDLPLVFSYELAHQADVHVHRVGRTGRAGKDGRALALVAPSEMGRVQAIEQQMGLTARWQRLDLSSIKLAPLKADWKTVVIDAGRKDKLRPGDILGALTAKQQIDGKSVGKIALFDTRSYVALHKSAAEKALQLLRQDKIKGRSFRVRLLSP
ncbi:ATP-dependent RNA helicase DbpA [Arenimonas sp. GDDSR-1]|uniref:ATP-dependent RNA helicase DbpA n=1 Tax=Arenimonas sp. GDDSR-1 TaxID=2950125 RepID=UPI002601A79F|nr:ATP-dependent RNA helicase DbpA [Arenimonas sp. GDDSR-1]